ncbi:MAG TPA: TIGR03067 domain-containing protein [Gemmataceae bacterium]|nr:TIGR03067 domain-containing protein [Gemmataceae bacterium]
MTLMPFVVLTLMLSFSLAARSGDAKDGDAIQGIWLPSAAEFGGKMFPEEVRKTIKLVVEGDKYTVTVGKEVDRGTVKLNPAAKPKELDITGTDGPNKGMTILAIYERDGDTLRVCYDLSGKSRPTEFKTKEGTQLFLVTYKREKQ